MRCGGPLNRGPNYNPQYNWKASGKPIVYPFIDDDMATVPKSTNFQESQGSVKTDGTSASSNRAQQQPVQQQQQQRNEASSTPVRRCGSGRRGRLVKPGRLGSNAVYHYASNQHRDPTSFIYVQGHNFGRVTDPLPPADPAPDEEIVMTTTTTTPGGERTREPRGRGGIKGDNDGENNDGRKEHPIQGSHEVKLHKSAVSLNISITNLGPDFKKAKIMERLKLLNAERSREASREGSQVNERLNVIRFSTEDEEAGLSDGDIECRSCDTCDGSLDFLHCSKPENQRKSIKLWREKDEEAFTLAYDKLAGELGTPREKENGLDGKESDSTISSISLNDSDHPLQHSKQQLNLSIRDLAVRGLSSGSVSPMSPQEDEQSLHASKQALNLSLRNVDNKLKREKILEKLKIINSEHQKTDSDTVRERKPVVRLSGEDASEEDTRTRGSEYGTMRLMADGREWDGGDDDLVRDCDSCKNSLDRLECHHPENARRTFQLWRERDISAIEEAVKRVASSKDFTHKCYSPS